jgi:hypothetical protein
MGQQTNDPDAQDLATALIPHAIAAMHGRGMVPPAGE